MSSKIKVDTIENVAGSGNVSLGSGHNLVVPGTLSITGASTLTGAVTANSGVTLGGTTPTLTIGDAGEEDTKIVFDGNAQDFHIGLDDSADSLTIGLGSALGTTSHMVIDATGAITKPLQPAFLANPATAGSSPVQTNISSGTTITFGNEVFDQNNDFASNTFTAPVTGKYQFNVGLFLEQVDTDYTELRIKLVTSNRNYDHFDIGSPFSSDRNLQYHLSALADMDASDTATIQVTFHNGGNQMDVNALTYFSGYLVC